MEFFKIESAYTSKDGCRLVWRGIDDDDTDTVILNKREFELLINGLQSKRTITITLEDEYSTIMVNSDVTRFALQNHSPLEVDTDALRSSVQEYAKMPRERQSVRNRTRKFNPSNWTQKNVNMQHVGTADVSYSLLNAILHSDPHKTSSTLPESDVFKVFASRRSTRKFAKKKVEDWKLDKILAVADTAPTAGNFQGLKIFYVKNPRVKEALVEAANKQPYVNAPAVLVFCMDPDRVKLKFSPDILSKFSIQDATITAAYAQIAATGLGLSSIWIGMLDEEKVMSILGTSLRPSSILCIGYPNQKKPPKPKKKLRELIEVID